VVNIAFYDFCGFRSVAVNSVYKLQVFLHSNTNIPDEVMGHLIIVSTKEALLARLASHAEWLMFYICYFLLSYFFHGPLMRPIISECTGPIFTKFSG